MALVLGVDSSTQATKVEVRDVDTGALVASGRNPHPPTGPPRSEQDPEAWWQALAPLLRDDVDAVAVAAQQHGMVVLDGARRVLRPAKLWNDTESAPDARRLVAEHGGPAWWAATCGSVPVPAFTVTKLAWLARCEPEHFAAVAHVLLPHDWLTFRLTGDLTTDRGDASGTGYWSPADGAWRADVLDLVGLGPGVTPRVLAPDEPAGSWQGTVVAPGTGDNMAAALGLGLRTGDVAISLGTSGTVYTVAGRPTADATGAVAGFADATGRYLPLVCTLNCTRVTETVARLLGVELGALDALALEAVPGAGGLVLVPYLDGERTPNRPDATGTLTGLRTKATRAELARASVEGVVCGLLDGLDALAATGCAVGPSDGRLFLVGGGARSHAYQRVVADLSGRPVIVPANEELVATGAAVQAAAVLTGATASEIAHSWRVDGGYVVEPDLHVDRDTIRTAYRTAAG